MVAGRLQEKNGFYYIVLSYTDSAGKRRQPWIGTGLPVKGNKKRAEKMLADLPRAPDSGHDAGRPWQGCHNSTIPLPQRAGAYRRVPPQVCGRA